MKRNALFAALSASPFRAQVLLFYVFDVLIYRGRNLLKGPLVTRREVLHKIVSGWTWLLRSVTGSGGNTSDAVMAANEFGLEGIVAKRKDSQYESGKRSGAWSKYK